MEIISLKAEIQVYSDIEALEKVDQQLLQTAEQSMHNAHAPYSNFKVGAAVLLSDQTIISGNNQENASYPAGTCAEQVALNYASAVYPNQSVLAIALQTKHPTTPQKIPSMPCGICRQAILEYQHKWSQDIKIITRSEQGLIYVAKSIDAILPMAFTKDAL